MRLLIVAACRTKVPKQSTSSIVESWPPQRLPPSHLFEKCPRERRDRLAQQFPAGPFPKKTNDLAGVIRSAPLWPVSASATLRPCGFVNAAAPRRAFRWKTLQTSCWVARHYGTEAGCLGSYRLDRRVRRRPAPCGLIPPQRRAVRDRSVDQSASAPKPDPSRYVHAQSCHRGSARSRPAPLPHSDS